MKIAKINVVFLSTLCLFITNYLIEAKSKNKFRIQEKIKKIPEQSNLHNSFICINFSLKVHKTSKQIEYSGQVYDFKY